ncbi:5'-methylthioadenosine/S-adenosylhomocysteine nucleosidase family protein [Flavitalea flava]
MTNTAPNSSLILSDLLSYNPLFVFALNAEAAQEFEGLDPLITGIGKVNAAFQLTRKIMEKRPGLIVNLGSAGSNKYERGEVVCCTKFIQRDMDVMGLGYKKFETPFSEIDPVLTYGLKLDGLPEGTCGTGDNFEMAHKSSEYDVIDMEAYALAFIAMKEQIPFLCLKYISDGADGTAAEEWLVQVHHAAIAFKRIISGLG